MSSRQEAQPRNARGGRLSPVTKRKPNPNGDVFIVEYHHITGGEGPMFRRPELFRRDLESLYKRGFRPVTLREYLKNDIKLAKGALPVVMTFDDSHLTQFRMLPNGSIDPQCAVGIWSSFAKTHPDFPVKATFFVLPKLFYQPRWEKQKVRWLLERGSEIASHTFNHVPLRKATPDRVKAELARAEEYLMGLGVPPPHTVAYPFGSTPKDFSVMHGFNWKGRRVDFLGAVLVGANPAWSPLSKKLDRLRIPRIQAYNGPYNLSYWLDQLDRGKVRPYVADGKQRGRGVGLPGPRGGGQSLGNR